MYIILALGLIVLGILANPSLLLNFWPDGKEYIDKVKPYLGYIGLGLLAIGVILLINLLLHLKYLSYIFIPWVSLAAASGVAIGLGFLLGFSTVSGWLSSQNKEIHSKGEEFKSKLAPLQNTLATVGVGLGLWMIIMTFIYKGITMIF